METTRSVRFTGGPAMAGLVAKAFRDEGVEVRYEPPTEARGLETMGEAVAVHYFVKGSDAAIKLAIARLREGFGDRGKVEEIDDED